MFPYKITQNELSKKCRDTNKGGQFALEFFLTLSKFTKNAEETMEAPMKKARLSNDPLFEIQKCFEQGKLKQRIV